MSAPFLVGNWKMNTTLTEAEELTRATVDLATRFGNAVDIGIAPPYLWIVPLSTLITGNPVQLGAQDVSAYDNGAYTGDISAAMLATYCSFTIIGHSERRAYHHETDEIVKTKIGKALAAGLNVILCVGETLDERNAGDAQAVVKRQLEGALDGMDSQDLARLTIAYEPVWAIGTGVAATPDDAAEMSVFIRAQLPAAGQDVRILYGGSANDANAASFLAAEAVGGLLIGGASLKIPVFSAMVEAAASL